MEIARRNDVTVTGNPHGPAVVPVRGSGGGDGDDAVTAFPVALR